MGLVVRMVYHSSYNEVQGCRQMCNMSILPLRTKYKGPAPPLKEDKPDVIDEALRFFKANVLFRNYEVKGPADRVLLWLTYYAKCCLRRLKDPANKKLKKFFTNSLLKTSKSLETVVLFLVDFSITQKADKKQIPFELISLKCAKNLVSDSLNLSTKIAQMLLLNGGFVSTRESS